MHTLRTEADGTRDPNAIRLSMGYTDEKIDDHDTHRIAATRLLAVSEFVRIRLFPVDVSKPSTPP